MAWTLFEYLYRDADNHKAFGKVALEGGVADPEWEPALRNFHDGSYFIAEQIGLPALYDQLHRWSGNDPTAADHCWHEFVSVIISDEAAFDANIPRIGSVKNFVERIIRVDNWNILLSPIVEHQRRNSPSW